MKNLVLVVIALVVFVMFILLKKDLLQQALTNMIIRHPYVAGLMAKNVALEKELASRVSVRDGHVTVVGRDNTGKPTGHTVVAPPEGGVDVITPSTGTPVRPGGFGTTDIGVEGSSTVVRVRYAGFCFYPQLSMEMSSEGALSPNLDFRIIYVRLWGLSVGVYPKPLVAVDRRLSDVVPFLRNSTLGLYKSFAPESQYGVRIAVFL